MRDYRIIIAVIAAAVLSSCNGSPGVIIPDFDQFDDIETRNVHITAAHDFSDSDYNAFLMLTEEFNDQNDKKIKVDLKRIKDRSEAGAFDCAFLPPSDSSFLLREEISKELSPLIAHPLYGLSDGRDIFYKAACRQTDYWDFSRRITSIPLLIDTEILLYNEDLLANAGIEKVPAMWPFFNITLYRVSRSMDAPAIGMALDSKTAAGLINARGGSIQNPSGLAYSFINPVVPRTIRYLRRLERMNLAAFNSASYENQTDFVFSKLPFVITGIDGIKFYSEMIEMYDPEMEWNTALIPTRRPGKGVSINSSVTAAVIDGERKKMLASWIFIKWLSGTAQQIKLAEYTGSVPANHSAVDMILTGGTAEYNQQWLNALRLVNESHMEYYPDLPDSKEVCEDFEETIKSCLNDGLWIWYQAWRLELRTRGGSGSK